MTRFDQSVEVEWGESQERPIFDRWFAAIAKARRARVKHVMAGPPYADYDFVLFDRRGALLAYVEVKKRRLEWGRFGDVLLPQRKRDFAVDCAAQAPYLAVTEYDCGTIVEVNLTTTEPVEVIEKFRRHDRGTQVPHVLYAGRGCKVVVAP